MDEFYVLLKIGGTVAGATATVISVISRPLWSKLNKMTSSMDQKIDDRLKLLEAGLDNKRNNMEHRIHGKLTLIGTAVDGIKIRVGEQNGRVGKLETWCEMHETHDDERHKESIESRKEVVTAVNNLRNRLAE